MKRRHFLSWCIGMAGIGLLPTRLSAQTHQMDHSMHSMSEPPLLPIDALPAGQPLAPLPRLPNASSKAGEYRAALTAKPMTTQLVPGTQTAVWVYSGTLPGPLIEVNEGDTVEILFVNRLPQATAVHWHGLLVPPDQDGTPHHPVAAGEERIYRFTLPTGSAGTYWYHPHPHDHTPEQVYRGLAGTLIVRAKDDPLAHLPEQHL